MRINAADASYYFWNWAENNLPGRPSDVHATLLCGKLHPALEPFDARPLLLRLQEAAVEGRLLDEQWTWVLHPATSPENARFVFVTCPLINASEERVRRFFDRFVPLGLSGYDEQHGHLIPCLRPKLNCFITGQLPHETAYDIMPDDLPVLLRRIRPDRPEPWCELLNRRDGVAAIAEGRRFRVEWREVHDEQAPAIFTQWRARNPKRLKQLDGCSAGKSLAPEPNPDLLTYAETLKVFRAFLCGQPRPAQYHWRQIRITEEP